MGTNPLELLKLMQNLKKNVGDMQEKLSEIKVIGTAGGDMVEITLNGNLDVLKVQISPDTINREDSHVLEDLIRAAFSDATKKAKEKMKEEFGFATGGFPLPPGLFGG